MKPSLSLTGDDGSDAWTSIRHGISYDLLLTVQGPDIYVKGVTRIVTEFRVSYKIHPPTLFTTGGEWQREVFHVPQETAVTITVTDSYFHGLNSFEQISSSV
jgi:hypothetical protein